MSEEQKRPRGTGCVYQQKGSSLWWIQYYRNGKPYRQSAGTSNRRKAERLLQRKLGEVATGNFMEPAAEKTLVKELAADLLTEYEANGRKSLIDVRRNWEKHLAPRFENLRAREVRPDGLNRYIAERQKEGASNATINRELAMLKRTFRLGEIAGKVAKTPVFPHLEERNVRQGFVEDAAYAKLAKGCAAVGLWLRTMFEVACAFGWRVDELRQLRVRQVDLAARTIRLEPGTTKNSEGRTVVMTELVYQLLAQCIAGKKHDESVFTREGKPVGDFRKTWEKVCKAAGVPELLFHDLRRTAVRNMVRRGIPERVAMTISGHKTRSVFDRYNIVSEADLREAAKKLDAALEPAAIAQHQPDYSHSSAIVSPLPAPVAKSGEFN